MACTTRIEIQRERRKFERMEVISRPFFDAPFCSTRFSSRSAPVFYSSSYSLSSSSSANTSRSLSISLFQARSLERSSVTRDADRPSRGHAVSYLLLPLLPHPLASSCSPAPALCRAIRSLSPSSPPPPRPSRQLMRFPTGPRILFHRGGPPRN